MTLNRYKLLLANPSAPGLRAEATNAHLPLDVDPDHVAVHEMLAAGAVDARGQVDPLALLRRTELLAAVLTGDEGRAFQARDEATFTARFDDLDGRLVAPVVARVVAAASAAALRDPAAAIRGMISVLNSQQQVQAEPASPPEVHVHLSVPADAIAVSVESQVHATLEVPPAPPPKKRGERVTVIEEVEGSGGKKLVARTTGG